MSDNSKEINFVSEYQKDSFLSKPKSGWVDFKPGDKVYEISYWRENLPIDWLHSAIEGMKSGNHFVVGGHQESRGPVYCVVPYDDYCYVIEPERDNKIEEFNCGRRKFCEILCNDLEKNVDEWAKWSASASNKLAPHFTDEDEEYNKKVIQQEKIEILYGINELRKILKKQNDFDIPEDRVIEVMIAEHEANKKNQA